MHLELLHGGRLRGAEAGNGHLFVRDDDLLEAYRRVDHADFERVLAGGGDLLGEAHDPRVAGGVVGVVTAEEVFGLGSIGSKTLTICTG